MSTPERSQDPGDHGYGSTDRDEVVRDHDPEHPLEDPELDSGQDEADEPEPGRDRT